MVQEGPWQRTHRVNRISSIQNSGDHVQDSQTNHKQDHLSISWSSNKDHSSQSKLHESKIQGTPKSKQEAFILNYCHE